MKENEKKVPWIHPKNNGLKPMNKWNKSPSKVVEICDFWGRFSFVRKLHYSDNFEGQTKLTAKTEIFFTLSRNG